jgi:hypothetical protein
MELLSLEQRLELHRRRRLVKQLRLAGRGTALPLLLGGLTAFLMLAVGSALH